MARCAHNVEVNGKDKITANCGGQAVYDAAGNNYLAMNGDFAKFGAGLGCKLEQLCAYLWSD